VAPETLALEAEASVANLFSSPRQIHLNPIGYYGLSRHGRTPPRRMQSHFHCGCPEHVADTDMTPLNPAAAVPLPVMAPNPATDNTPSKSAANEPMPVKARVTVRV